MPSKPNGFQLRFPAGSAWLQVLHGAPVARAPALQQALALETALPVLAALEAWLDAALLSVAPAEAATELPALTLRTHDGRLQLDLPAPLLPWSRTPPPALLPGAWHWPSWSARVQLGGWPAAWLSAAQLHDGALVLLPASFGLGSAAWPVQLQRACGPASHAPAGRWQPQAAQLVVDPSAAAPAARDGGHGDDWQAELADAVEVGAQAWFGVVPPPCMPPGRTVRLLHAGQALAQGALLPCGQGHGVLIAA